MRWEGTSPGGQDKRGWLWHECITHLVIRRWVRLTYFCITAVGSLYNNFPNGGDHPDREHHSLPDFVRFVTSDSHYLPVVPDLRNFVTVVLCKEWFVNCLLVMSRLDLVAIISINLAIELTRKVPLTIPQIKLLHVLSLVVQDTVDRIISCLLDVWTIIRAEQKLDILDHWFWTISGSLTSVSS